MILFDNVILVYQFLYPLLSIFVSHLITINQLLEYFHLS